MYTKDTVEPIVDQLRDLRSSRRPFPDVLDTDQRFMDYVDAAGDGDYDKVSEIIDSALDDEDSLLILRRFVTANIIALKQFRHMQRCLAIAQQEARGWRNVGKGLRGQTKLPSKDVKRGDRQVAEAEAAKAEMGEDYLEITWK